MSQNSHILIQQLCFNLPDGNPLFKQLSFTLSQIKTGLVGRNGIGKSTLLKLIHGDIQAGSGTIQIKGTLAYVPQNPQLSGDMTIAEYLGFSEKLAALQRILHGSIVGADFTILNDAWDIEEQLQQQLQLFGLDNLPFHHRIAQMSGGEITRLLLTKAFVSSADFLLLDEPTNHLDIVVRKQLYEAIAKWQGGILVVSHDRALLNLLEQIVELHTYGLEYYGGNYDAYISQKAIELTAREQQLHDAKKLAIKSKRSIQASREKHEQKQAYGRALRKNGSIDKMGANSKKGRSERTRSALLTKEERMLQQADNLIVAAHKKMEIIDEINLDLPLTKVPNSKIMLKIENLSFTHIDTIRPLIDNFSLTLQGPERLALVGANGSGKTTLVNLILGKLAPQNGEIYLGTKRINYLDQNASLLDPELSVLANFLKLNPDATEQQAYQFLARFLFKNVNALKLVKYLSGGEKLRALLAATLLSNYPPHLLILDEPTNHLDLASIENIENALKNYEGALLVISHDEQFLQNIGVSNIIVTPFTSSQVSRSSG